MHTTNTKPNVSTWYEVTQRDPGGGLRTIDVRLSVLGDGPLAADLDHALRLRLASYAGVIHVRSVPLPDKEVACGN